MEAFSLFGKTYGFELPALLFAAPVAIAALVYAYRKHGRGKLVVVSSTFILKNLASKRPARQKFMPPLRFFVELLASLLLVAAAAKFYVSGEGERVAVLIDNSFSMLARDLSQGDGASLLDVAKKQAAAYIDSLGSFSSIKVYATSPALRPLTDGFVDKSSALQKIKDINGVFAPDRIEGALVKLFSESKFSALALFSDKKMRGEDVENIRQSNRLIYAPSLRPQNATFNNVAITDVKIKKESISSLSNEILVAVASYSENDEDLAIELRALDYAGGSYKKREVAKRNLSLAKKALKTERFSKVPPAKAYEIEIVAPKSLRIGLADALPHDNKAWISAETLQTKVNVVSPRDPNALGLSRIKGLSFKYFSAKNFDEKLLSEDGDSTWIFHGILPREIPKGSSIFINPPEGDFFLKVKPLVKGKNIEITSWSNSHPLTSYVNFSLLSLKAVNPLEPPLWALPVISTTAGPIAIAGENGGKRYAAFGFELLPYKGRERPVLSILTLNTLKWVVNFGLAAGYAKVYAPFNVSEDLKTVRSLDGSFTFEIAQNSRFEHFTQPGLYELISKGGERNIVAVNFFDRSESNLLAALSYSVPSISRPSKSEVERNFLSNHIVILILIILVLDMLFSTRYFGLLSFIAHKKKGEEGKEFLTRDKQAA